MDPQVLAALAARLKGLDSPQGGAAPPPGGPPMDPQSQGMPPDQGMPPGQGPGPEQEGPMDAMELALAREQVKNSLKQLRLQEMESGIAAQRQQGMADIQKEAAGLDKPKKY